MILADEVTITNRWRFLVADSEETRELLGASASLLPFLDVGLCDAGEDSTTIFPNLRIRSLDLAQHWRPFNVKLTWWRQFSDHPW